MKSIRKLVLAKKETLLLLTSLFVFIFSYQKVPFLFFQQDELFSFGFFIKEGISSVTYFFGLNNITHLTPVTFGLSYILYSVFGLRYWVYDALGLFIHFLNGVLIYLIAKEVFCDKTKSILSSILFFSFSQAYELVMWPVASLNTLSLFFSLSAILLIFKSFKTKSKLTHLVGIIISILFLLSVFSMEYALFMAIFIPLMVFMLDSKKKRAMVSLIPFAAVVLGYFLIRFVPLLSSGGLGSAISDFPESSILSKMIWYITFPLVYLGQLFAGQDIILNISKAISTVFFGISENWIFAEKIIYKNVAIIFSLLFLILFFLIVRNKKTFSSSKKVNIFIFIIFIVFSSFPFFFVPDKNFNIVPPRYLYFGTAGLSLLFIGLLEPLTRLGEKTIFLAYSFFIGLMILLGTWINYSKSSVLLSSGSLRLKILNFVIESHPSLLDKTIFYTISDRSYFGLPSEEKILPFQSGFGQTLLIYYYPIEKFPKKFFQDRFLWDIESQDYLSDGKEGFGYYRDYELLKKSIIQNKLGPENVIAFEWSGNNNKLVDVSQEIRMKLEKDFK